ncbi:MAG: 1,4-beta-xylanase [Brevundimonas sp.]|nr:MAG: 1,4-beta-xylanase [Brevundimonas sp.]
MAACGPVETAAQPDRPVPALKDIAPFPIGACVPTAYLDDPAWVALATRQLSQLTPEWELKMEYVLQDGSYRFEAPDRIAAFAREHGMRLYCTTLIWYSQVMPFFRDMDPSRVGAEYDRYIAAVVGRYAGQAVGWDVVNEAVAEDGIGLRDTFWGQNLGGEEAYIARAFHQAKAADPDAVLFINEYNLENNPVKGATYLRLIEKLLKAGVPIGGIGVQSHLDIEIPDGNIRTFMRDAGALGLPIHVSELDASLRREGRLPDLRTRAEKREKQVARVAELAEAFMALPAAQRFGFTTWGLRDIDSWLRRPPQDDGKDSMLLFDAKSRPNPMFWPVAEAFGG